MNRQKDCSYLKSPICKIELFFTCLITSMWKTLWFKPYKWALCVQRLSGTLLPTLQCFYGSPMQTYWEEAFPFLPLFQVSTSPLVWILTSHCSFKCKKYAFWHSLLLDFHSFKRANACTQTWTQKRTVMLDSDDGGTIMSVIPLSIKLCVMRSMDMRLLSLIDPETLGNTCERDRSWYPERLLLISV